MNEQPEYAYKELELPYSIEDSPNVLRVHWPRLAEEIAAGWELFFWCGKGPVVTEGAYWRWTAMYYRFRRPIRDADRSVPESSAGAFCM
jgi:hypothetical protein